VIARSPRSASELGAVSSSWIDASWKLLADRGGQREVFMSVTQNSGKLERLSKWLFLFQGKALNFDCGNHF
jgi:hypothetical protein